MTPIIYPYNMGSRSARDLARSLNTRRVYPDRKYRRRDNHVVINWGSSKLPFWNCEGIINHPHYVSVAANKLKTLNALYGAGVSVPEYTTSFQTALRWLSDGDDMLARLTLTGHSGRGIELLRASDGLSYLDVPEAPLYTKYIKKKYEYRVHVEKLSNGTPQVFDIQQKKRNLSVPDDDVNWQIRNYYTGWIYARGDIDPPQCVLDEACKALDAIGLDFAAMDVVYNEQQEKSYVLEVNTAPGLDGTTLDLYNSLFKSIT